MRDKEERKVDREYFNNLPNLKGDEETELNCLVKGGM